jgi:CheY-like chemotaxis protein
MEPKRILIVDDEVGLTRLVQMTLEKTGAYAVRAVNHPHLAVAAALEFRPQLILLDIMMPGLDGTEVAIRLRATPELKTIPIVFLTAIVGRNETGPKVIVRGGEQFLAKPVTLETLVACIEKNLKH